MFMCMCGYGIHMCVCVRAHVHLLALKLSANREKRFPLSVKGSKLRAVAFFPLLREAFLWGKGKYAGFL